MRLSENKEIFQIEINRCFERGKAEILEMMQFGEIPESVRDLYELNEYIDGNMLGGSDELYDKYGLEDSSDVIEQAQCLWNSWLVGGKR